MLEKERVARIELVVLGLKMTKRRKKVLPMVRIIKVAMCKEAGMLQGVVLLGAEEAVNF